MNLESVSNHWNRSNAADLFAAVALIVYYAKFPRTDSSSPKNGIARWCRGLRKFTRGHDIEPDDERREHLASRCLPRHYDDSGAAQPALLEQSGQAIASAPVTCELCHVGLAGHDKLRDRCQKNIVVSLNTESALSTELEKKDPVLCCLGPSGAWSKAFSSFASILCRVPATTGR